MAERVIKNQDVAFEMLRRELDHASTETERMALLERLVALEPRGDRALRLRTRLKGELETLRRKGGSKEGHASDPYHGLHHDRQVAIVGVANSGKSTLLNRLTGGDAVVSPLPFATHRPEVGMLDVNDVSFQVVEVPALFSGEENPGKFRFIRNASIVCATARGEEEYHSIRAILTEKRIELAGVPVPASEHRQRPMDVGVRSKSVGRAKQSRR